MTRLQYDNHGYISFYETNIFGPERDGWIGYGSSTNNNLTIANEEAGGHIVFYISAGGSLYTNPGAL